MNEIAPLWLELTRVIPAPCSAVFDAWLSPTAMTRFLCPAAGVTVQDIKVDAQVGGTFSLTMVAGQTQIPVRGRYLVLDRPRALAFTWLSAHTAADSVVNLAFESIPEGTHMTLRHEGFPDAEACEDHRGGWQHILHRLAETELGRGVPVT